MVKTTETKDTYLAAMAEFVLEHGFEEASLRPLAKAAGTSDRMLIYHFGNKDRLMAQVIAALAEDFTGGLDQALPDKPCSSQRVLLDAVLSVVRSPDVAPYVRVWQEMTAQSAKGEHAHVEAGRKIVEGFVEWLQQRMPDDEPDPKTAARAMLTLIEGVHVMDSVGRPDLVEAAIDAFYPAT